MWNFFKKYHYLNHSLLKTSKQYVAYYENRPCAFFALINFPHPHIKKAKISHRLVVLPDYQGVGIGYSLQETIAEIWVKDGYRFFATTSNPALVHHRKKSKHWVLKSFGHMSQAGKTSSVYNKPQYRKMLSVNRLTSSWEYVL